MLNESKGRKNVWRSFVSIGALGLGWLENQPAAAGWLPCVCQKKAGHNRSRFSNLAAGEKKEQIWLKMVLRRTGSSYDILLKSLKRIANEMNYLEFGPPFLSRQTDGFSFSVPSSVYHKMNM